MFVVLLGCTDDSHKPIASFTIQPLTPQINTTVFFNSTSMDTKYDIVSYQWYINEEFIEDKINITFSFETNGSYNISLKVRNSQGISDSYSETLIIGQDVKAKQKLIGLWQWSGNNQLGNWTFYNNNTLKSVFTGVLPNGEYGANTTAYWNYAIDDSYLYFTEPSNEYLDPAIYSYEFLDNDNLLRIGYDNYTADWYRIS
jgi:PKD repeat protein